MFFVNELSTLILIQHRTTNDILPIINKYESYTKNVKDITFTTSTDIHTVNDMGFDEYNNTTTKEESIEEGIGFSKNVEGMSVDGKYTDSILFQNMYITLLIPNNMMSIKYWRTIAENMQYSEKTILNNYLDKIESLPNLDIVIHNLAGFINYLIICTSILSINYDKKINPYSYI